MLKKSIQGLRFNNAVIALLCIFTFATNANADCQSPNASTPVTTTDETSSISGSRQLSPSSTTTIDTSTPGQIKVNVSLPNSGVTAGTYTNATIGVNAQGLVTSASNGSGGTGANAFTAGNLPATVPNVIVPASGLIQPFPYSSTLTPASTPSEYSVPTSSSNPLAVCAGPDHNVWVTESNQNKIAKISPSGTFTEYTVPTSSSTPWGICAGPDGNLWFTENSGNKIGKITTSGTITEYTITTSSSQPTGICAGPDGNLWFTENNGNKIGKITTSGTITEYSVTTSSSQPRTICAGPDGNLWFVETAGNKIASIAIGGTIAEYTVPTSSASPYNICAGPDGNLWFTESATNKIGKVSTTGTFVEYTVPTSSSTPYGICAGPDGNLWFCENATDKIASINIQGIIQEYMLSSSSAGASCICVGPDGGIWLTEQAINKAATWKFSVIGSGTGGGATISTGTWAARPTSSNSTQRLYLPTDAPIQVIDNTSTLEYRAFGYTVTPPVSSDFTTYDPGSASTVTTDNSHGGVIFSVQNPTSNHETEFLKALNNTSNYTVTIGTELLLLNQNYFGSGICVQDSSTGKSSVFIMAYASGWVYGIYHLNADTTWNSTVYQSTEPPLSTSGAMRFFRITNDGTNRKYQVSVDGYSWITLASEASGTWVTETHWGPSACTQGSTAGSAISHVLHAKEGTP